LHELRQPPVSILDFRQSVLKCSVCLLSVSTSDCGVRVLIHFSKNPRYQPVAAVDGAFGIRMRTDGPEEARVLDETSGRAQV
jgi:hypothetical protein